VPPRALILAFLLACSLAPSLAFGAKDARDLEASLARLTEVVRLLETRSAEPVDLEDAVYHGAVPALVRALDPFSAFLDPAQFESLQEMQRSTEKGFGSVLSVNNGRVVVLQTLPDSPSARSGMSPGDEIIVVNGHPTANLSIDQLVALLSQTRQAPADLAVKRPNFARLIPLTLTPAELEDPSVQGAFFVKPGVAYVKVANFESQTDADLREQIEEMGGEELRGLVLDFRDNPGGVIEAAVRMAALFLDEKDRILWIQGRDGPQEEVRVPKGAKGYQFPLAVLTDQRTASAAELVAGAWQDNDRALIVGTRSFGKGLVQSVFPLTEGTGLALTTARYLSPSGRPIQRPLSDCAELQLDDCEQETPKTYKTVSGRKIPGGGGVQPDRIIYPRSHSPFEYFLMSADAFLVFAQTYTRDHPEIEATFEVDSSLLNEFQTFLSQRGVRPTLSEWGSSLEFVRMKLHQEILTLAVGVAAGDEVERRADPQVLAAVQELGL